MAEGEFDKFGTDLGDAMWLMKHKSSDGATLLESEKKDMKVSPETARFLNAAINLKGLAIMNLTDGTPDSAAERRNRNPL